MIRRLGPLVIAWIVVVAIVAPMPGDAQQAAAPDPAFLKQYCITCHNQQLKTAGLALDALDVAQVGPDAETWEKAVRKIRTGMMPPSGARRPERAALDAFSSQLEASLDRAATPGASLATPALHRLNRNEYANAIRDLLALEVDVATLLPADGSSEGFDNIAEALSVSPSLIQGYVSAAMKISRLAVGDRTLAPSQITYSAPGRYAQDRHIDGLPLGTRGGLLFRHTFPLDAEYEFSIGGGAGGGPGGGAGGAALDLTIDGEKVEVTNPRGFRLPIAAGPHAVGVAIVDSQRGAGVDEIYSDFRIDAAFTPPGGVNTVTITGPFDATGVGDTPSRRRIFVCRPSERGGGAPAERGGGAPAERGGGAPATNEETACARRIMTTLARRAYRGPVSAAEIDTLMGFFQ